MAFHPQVEAFLARGRELGEMLGKVQAAAFEDLRVRRAAPEEPNLMPEIDGYGALTDLFMEGIVGRYTPHQIETLFMSAMNECYEVLNERRQEAARAAIPDLDPELGLG